MKKNKNKNTKRTANLADYYSVGVEVANKICSVVNGNTYPTDILMKAVCIFGTRACELLEIDYKTCKGVIDTLKMYHPNKYPVDTTFCPIVFPFDKDGKDKEAFDLAERLLRAPADDTPGGAVQIAVCLCIISLCDNAHYPLDHMLESINDLYSHVMKHN